MAEQAAAPLLKRLSAIGDTARAALTEMRRLLGVLREDARTDPAQRRPQPGLRQLNELLDEARDATRAGTRLILHGSPVPLDPGVELAAYRIVQEALTNSRRHAPGAAVDVELHYTSNALRLLIRDNGPGPSAPTQAFGHGLLGMRERAAAVGGELRIEAPRVRWDILDAFRDAAKEAGVAPIADFNTGDNEGSCVFHVNQKRGRRWSAARGFLKPVLGRPNLRLETQCLVKGLIFDGKRAVGVRWRQNGATRSARCRGEVVLELGHRVLPVVHDRGEQHGVRARLEPVDQVLGLPGAA